jgi:hypothetical protein
MVLAAVCGVALLRPLALAEEDKLTSILDASPMQPAKGDDELHKLLKERYNAALDEVQVRLKQFRDVRAGNLNDLGQAARRLLDARLELCANAAERVPVYEQHLEMARTVEKIQKARYDTGQASAADWHQARFQRLDVEIQLLRAKKAADTKPKE